MAISMIANATRAAREAPPREWFYYVHERVLKNLKAGKKYPFRPGTPYKTKEQLASAITGWLWWSETKPTTKKRIMDVVKRNRARGVMAVVTSKGTISRAQVASELGRAVAARVYKRIGKLKAAEIKEAQLRVGVKPRKVRRKVANPRLSKEELFLVDTAQWCINTAKHNLKGYDYRNALVNAQHAQMYAKIGKSARAKKLLQEAKNIIAKCEKELRAKRNPRTPTVREKYSPEYWEFLRGKAKYYLDNAKRALKRKDWAAAHQNAEDAYRHAKAIRSERLLADAEKVMAKAAEEYDKVLRSKRKRNPLTEKEYKSIVSSAEKLAREAEWLAKHRLYIRALDFASAAEARLNTIYAVETRAIPKALEDRCKALAAKIRTYYKLARESLEAQGKYEPPLGNPELMLMLNPRKSRKPSAMKPRAQARGGKRQSNPSLSSIQNSKEFKAALAAYRKFHGTEAMEIIRVKLPYNAPKVLVALGDSPEAVYKVPKHSRKQSKVPYKHDYEGKVLKCTDSKGKAIIDVPVSGNVRVTDFIHG